MLDMVPATFNDVMEAGSAWDRHWGRLLASDSSSYYLRPHENIVIDAPRHLKDMSEFDFYVSRLGTIKNTGEGIIGGIWLKGADIVGKRVVEFGSGVGLNAQIMSNFSSRYMGVECSRAAIALAKLNNGKRVRFVNVADFVTFKDLAESFDTAYASNVCLHQNVSHLLFMLKQMRNLLKREGVVSLGFTSHQPGSVPGLIYSMEAPLDIHNPTAAYWYGLSDLEVIAKIGGFRLLKVEEQKAMGYIFARLMKI